MHRAHDTSTLPSLPSVTPPTRPRPPLSARSHSLNDRRAPQRGSYFFPSSPGAAPVTSAGAGEGVVRRASFHTSEELVTQEGLVKQVLNNLIEYGKFSRLSGVAMSDNTGIIFACALIFAFFPGEDFRVALFEGTCYEVHSAVTKLVFRSTLADLNIAELVPRVAAFMRGSGFAEESRRECITYDSTRILIRGVEDVCPVVSISNECLMSVKFLDKLKLGLDQMQEFRPDLYEELQLQQGARVVLTARVVEGVRAEIAKIHSKFPGERVLSLASLEDSAAATVDGNAARIATLDFALATILMRHLNIFLEKLRAHRFNLIVTPMLSAYFRGALGTAVESLMDTCEYDRAGLESPAGFFGLIAVSLTSISGLLTRQIDFEQTVEDTKFRGSLPPRRFRAVGC